MIFDRDSWQEIAHTLKKNKLRSFLTAFGVFWGIFLLLIMVGAGTGLQNGAMDNFSDRATNSVYIWTRPTTIPYKGFPIGRRFYFDNDDIKALRQNIPEILHLGPRNQMGGHRGVTNVTRGLKDGAFSINGDYPEYRLIQLLQIKTGRFINHLDMRDRRKVAVIGTRVREVLFEKEENPIGEHILVKGVYFKVVGVFAANSEGDEAEEETQTVFIPFTTFQHAFNFGQRVSWFSITSQPDVPASVVEKRAIALLAKRHQVSPEDQTAFGRYNVEKEYRKMVNLFKGINILIWFVGTFTLIAGVIGVSNIMLIIVKERTREIGIRRAIGATPLNILTQIMTESVLLTAVSGYMGLVAGVGIIELLSRALTAAGTRIETFKNPEIDLRVAITALSILVICGVLAGLIPGKKAISIKPVEAIRDD
ncbi:MAG: ABC transporter permease [Deltaproteobacteria bacterium]|nr:ABC transporter permease [Deltaproteobacteria bacterium]